MIWLPTIPRPVVSIGLFSLSSVPGTGFGVVPSSVPGAGFGVVPSSVPGAGFGTVPSSVPGAGFGAVPGFSVAELLFSANPLSIFDTKYFEMSSAFATSITPLLPFILPTLLYPVL